jgi:chloramphenicol 3-O-phosphotransferase
VTRRIFVLSGLQAAGKTTVAGVLARRYPRGVHIAGDSIRAMVVAGRVDMTPDSQPGATEQLLARYEASIAVARVYHDAGFAVVIEDVILGKMVLRFLELMPWPEIHFVMLTPNLESVARRELERPKKAYGQAWSVRSLGAVLEDTPFFGWWLDSSGLTAEQTADAILSDLDRSRIGVRDVLARHDQPSLSSSTEQIP